MRWRAAGGKATLFSFALMIYSASGVFQPLEAALNRAWGFKERDFIKQYATYLLLAVACVVIMLAPVALASLYDFVIAKVLGVFGESVNPLAQIHFLCHRPAHRAPVRLADIFHHLLFRPERESAGQPDDVHFDSHRVVMADRHVRILAGAPAVRF